jgi:hypothetical protein
VFQNKVSGFNSCLFLVFSETTFKMLYYVHLLLFYSTIQTL